MLTHEQRGQLRLACLCALIALIAHASPHPAAFIAGAVVAAVLGVEFLRLDDDDIDDDGGFAA